MKGQIIKEIGALPEKHELLTADVLAMASFDVKFLRPISGRKTPGIEMNKLKWEIKAPKDKGKDLIHNAIHRASAQSPNIIIDLHRIKMPEDKAIISIIKYANELKNVKRVKVISKSREIIDIKK